jgi:hypothetical protein
MKTLQVAYVTTIDLLMNGLTRGVDGPIMPIVRYFPIICTVYVCVCVYIYIYITPFFIKRG